LPRGEIGEFAIRDPIVVRASWEGGEKRHRAYCAGAGLTGIGPSPFRAADLSNRGLKASIVRSVSENQPLGAETVGAWPGPGTMWTIL
jgi:hypothetical protein